MHMKFTREEVIEIIKYHLVEYLEIDEERIGEVTTDITVSPSTPSGYTHSELKSIEIEIDTSGSGDWQNGPYRSKP